jgi:hypothetical protein
MTCSDRSHFPVHIVAMELNVSRPPDDAIHVSGFCVVKLNAVSQVDTVFATADLSGCSSGYDVDAT